MATETVAITCAACRVQGPSTCDASEWGLLMLRMAARGQRWTVDSSDMSAALCPSCSGHHGKQASLPLGGAP
jgi:hypothetical protein